MFDLVKGFSAEILGFQHFPLGLLHQFADSFDFGVLEAVDGPHRELEFAYRPIEIVVDPACRFLWEGFFFGNFIIEIDENVHVLLENLGGVGQGLQVSMTTLMNERLAVGGSGGADVQDMIKLAQSIDIDDKPAITDQAVRAKIAEWYCKSSGLKYTKARVLSALSRGATPGPENSIAKIVNAGILQDMGTFGLDLLDMGGILTDPERAPFDGKFYDAFMRSPAMRIAGGTDEILRDIIARRVLRLPPEPRVDKNVPFSEIPTGPATK